MQLTLRIRSLPEAPIPRIAEEGSPSTFFRVFGNPFEAMFDKHLYAPARLIADHSLVSGDPAPDDCVFAGWRNFARCGHVRPNV